MNVYQIQCLLAYLGYYTGKVDGIWGDLSLDATIAFQDDFGGIAVDGNPGRETQQALKHAVAYGMLRSEAKDEPESEKSWKKKSPYFEKRELACQCGECGGFPVEPDEELVIGINEFRRRLGVPVYIVDAGGSGVRCAKHNASIPNAAKNSQHLYGKAADLHSSKSPEEMYRVAEEVLGNTGGIGLYSWGIHFDVRSVKARWKG